MSRVFTVGHSTHELPELVALLRRHDVAALADVRTAPRSRRTPQFNREALARELPGLGVRYLHLPELGGWRSPRPGSPNDGWRNRSFRGYADHMDSPEFRSGLSQLEELARERPTAFMCSEALWWRCHRRLVADALTVRGWSVEHIGADGRAARHALTPFAVREDDGVRYTLQASLGDVAPGDHMLAPCPPPHPAPSSS